ncbi:MAG: imidazolonepropionase [Anaerolineales bacterium]|nr:imidazolonepropionase [Anaerolineales bacterium]
MKETADFIVHNIGQMVTCASPNGVKRGAALADVGALADGALVVKNGRFSALGPSTDILNRYHAPQMVDAQGKAVVPGFVDCHTHVVYGGDRAHEFELRVRGASYMEIMAAGGGIVSTMRHTREATLDELIAAAKPRLDTMLSLGSTTIEVKTGYGLNTETELKILQAIAALDLAHPCQLVPTFLGAHTLPPEYKDNGDGYVEMVIHEMIPAVMDWYHASHFATQDIPLFIDVFCEDHAFDVGQTRRILAAGLAAGMRAKIHVDQFNSLGGLAMALELGATSADHLEVTRDEGDIARLAGSETVAVLMPTVNFNLGLHNFAAGRALVDAGTAVALATDMNPGSAPCFSMPLTMAIACRYLRLLPSEALTAGTLNAAHAIGLGQQIGSLEVGKRADFLLLNTPDYRNLAYLLGGNVVERVVKGGCLLN